MFLTAVLLLLLYTRFNWQHEFPERQANDSDTFSGSIVYFSAGFLGGFFFWVPSSEFSPVFSSSVSRRFYKWNVMLKVYTDTRGLRAILQLSGSIIASFELPLYVIWLNYTYPEYIIIHFLFETASNFTVSAAHFQNVLMFEMSVFRFTKQYFSVYQLLYS